MNFERETDGESVEAIPGAFVVDPSVLRKTPQIAVPGDIKIILYCSSGSDMVSARAAVGLRRIGIEMSGCWKADSRLGASTGFPSPDPRKHQNSLPSGMESSCQRLRLAAN